MPPAAKTPGLDAGAVAEIRVARAWYWDGYFVRRGVDLQHRFGPDVSTITDLDVLGYSFDEALSHHKQVGEVKTGKSGSTPRPLDRALWMRGVRELVGADKGEVTTALQSSMTARDVCRSLGVTIQHMDDLTAREARLHIDGVADAGSQGEYVALLRKRVHSFVKKDPTLERGYWFLVSEVWFLEPFDALKRTLGLLRQLSKSWPPHTHVDALEAAQWFFAEAVSIVGLNLVIVAGESLTMSEKQFQESAEARLASGDVPFFALRALSERVDEYLGKILGSLDTPPEVRIGAMGAFLPTPPEYTEPLMELISRLASEARATSRLPRQLDAVIFERLVHGRSITPMLASRLGLNRNSERQFRLIAAFLRGQFSLPDQVDDAIATELFETAPKAEVETQLSMLPDIQADQQTKT